MNIQERRMWRIPLLVFAAALALNLGVGVAGGLRRKMESDAYYYFQLATSLARGEGYVVRDGFWPDAPSLQRMPGWPGAVAGALKVCRGLPRPAVMRTLDLVVNAGCAALVAALALALFRRPGVGAAAGGIYMLHPMGYACAVEGMSEPLFILLAAAGALLLYRGLAGITPAILFSTRRAVALLAGFLLLGLACLVRANFVTWVCFFGCWAAWRTFFGGMWRRPAWWALMLAGALLFALPATLWAVRNYHVTGAFPVLSTLRGQTFYGGNNALTVAPGRYWGYWVFPNEIPGETPLYDLSRSMSEYDVDVYYYEKGQAFLREHRGEIPLLMLGKLIRAYVPVPWHWSPGTVLMAAFRCALYALIALGLWRAWRTPAPAARAMLIAMALANVQMVLTFYGYSRFAFALEPFFIPFAAVAVVDLAARVRRRVTA